MTRSLLLSAVFLVASACTAPAPYAGAGPEKSSSTASGVDDKRPAVADRDLPSVNTAPDSPGDVIQVAEIPRVEAAVAPVPRAKKVCRRIQPTGSHTTRRVCFTQAEMDASTADAREVFDELHRQQQLPIN